MLMVALLGNLSKVEVWELGFASKKYSGALLVVHYSLSIHCTSSLYLAYNRDEIICSMS